MCIASFVIISEYLVVHKSGLEQERYNYLFGTCRKDNLLDIERHISLLRSLILANALPMRSMLAAMKIFLSLMLQTNS